MEDNLETTKSAHLATAEDGHSFELVVFAPRNLSVAAPTILIHPALGTPAGYYLKLAESLSARNNWIVAITELRGNASSSWRASRRVNWTYWTTPTQDIPASVALLRKLYPKRKIYLMGHSIGGVMMSMYASRLQLENPASLDEIGGIMIIASGSLYYKTYPNPNIWWVSVLIVVLVYAFGYLPGKLINFGGKAEAKGLMLDWSREIRTGVCSPTGCPHENITAPLKKIQKPVLFISFDKDAFVPHESASRFASFYDDSRVTHIKVDPNDYDELKPLSKSALHFKWARTGAVVPLIEDWVSSTM